MTTHDTIATLVSTEAAEEKPSADIDARLEWSERVIRNHTLVAAGVGLVPMPGVDVLALSGVQLNLLRELSNYYGVPFSQELSKKIVATLFGAYLPIALALPVASVIKIVPIIGQALGGFAATVTSGAATYALGKVFVQHFESGGTFLDFNPKTAHEYFRAQFSKGQDVVKQAAQAKKAADKI